MADFQTIEAPAAGIYRIGYREPGPFVPPPWSKARNNGAFSGRFDDPRVDLPENQRFRVIYAASSRRGAYGESLVGYQVPLRLTARLDVVIDDESVTESFGHAVDPENPSRGLVSAGWRRNRAIGHTILERTLPFVDLGSAWTLQQLRESADLWSPGMDMRDIDLSLVMGPARRITQRIARHMYEQVDAHGAPRFAGIRYISRLDQDWECWAIFADRIHHTSGMPKLPETIFPDDPDLLKVASIFRLTVETIEGSGRYYRP